MKRTIFVLEDDSHIRELILYNLKQEGYVTYGFGDGTSFYGAIKDSIPDACILDIMLPDVDGIDVLKSLRMDTRTANIPVIMLTAKTTELDKIIGLEMGADDYVTKPFSVRELISRIKSLFRRIDKITSTLSEKTIINNGEFIIDTQKRLVTKNGEIIDMNFKEFELFKLLLSSPDRVFSRDELLDKIWGYDFIGETRTVDVHIRQLRKKVEEDDHSPRYIITVRNVGYKFTNNN
jgi:two-component system alkaline phosphatase synthesis response regulator PhoP